MTKIVPMIRTLQHLGATREDITAFIKKAKTKKLSPKLDGSKNFDNTKLKPVLPDNAPITVVLFAGGGGIEAGMVEAGIRPVIAVEFDPSKPDLSRAIALNHHHNFSEYGCRVVQLTVQEVAQSGFLGFPRRPDYLHASPVCANFSQAHTAKAGVALETADDMTAANRQVGASLSQWQKPSDICSHGCLPSKMFHAIKTVRVSPLSWMLWNPLATESATASSTWLTMDCPRRDGD